MCRTVINSKFSSTKCTAHILKVLRFAAPRQWGRIEKPALRWVPKLQLPSNSMLGLSVTWYEFPRWQLKVWLWHIVGGGLKFYIFTLSKIIWHRKPIWILQLLSNQCPNLFLFQKIIYSLDISSYRYLIVMSTFGQKVFIIRNSQTSAFETFVVQPLHSADERTWLVSWRRCLRFSSKQLANEALAIIYRYVTLRLYSVCNITWR